jgi:hypothetical protein
LPLRNLYKGENLKLVRKYEHGSRETCAHRATRSILAGFLASTIMLPTLDAVTDSVHDIILLEGEVLFVRSNSGLLAAR